MKRKMFVGLAALLSVAIAGGCSAEKETEKVSVEQIKLIQSTKITGTNSFTGIIQSQEEFKINKDQEKKLKEVLVKVGDTVVKDQLLFTYDNTDMKSELSKLQLDTEKLQNSISGFDLQISGLEAEKKKAPETEQLSYTTQIQELQANKKETEYSIKVNNAKIESMKKTIENTEVKSPCDGTVKKISDPTADMGMDSGTDTSYMVIVKSGEYSVKGTVNELNISEITSEKPVLIRSRKDNKIITSGKITKIDTENQLQQQSQYMMMDNGDVTNSTSKYPFYVSIDSSEGLFLGQHVYIEPDFGQKDIESLMYIPNYYIKDIDKKPYVWAVDKDNKLEKRSITIGEKNEYLDVSVVEKGLTEKDYIAYPDSELEEGQSVVKFSTDDFVQKTEGSTVGEVK